MCLAFFDDKKKHYIYLLMQNLFVDIEKGGLIQALIYISAARAVNQKDVLDCILKSLSAKFLGNEIIMSVHM